MTVTLADVERAVAQRTGPFFRVGISSTTPSTLSRAYVDRFASTLNQGGLKNLYILRRGYTTAGVAIVGFNANDRQRRVKQYVPASGALDPDSPWAVAPAAGEEVELCHLSPEDTIRPAVQAGLRRCYFRDTVTVALTGAASERDVSVALPWLEDSSQIVGVSSAGIGSIDAPVPIRWAKPFMSNGHVWLGAAPDPFPDTLYLTVTRPASSLVNGIYSTTGPTVDTDTLAVPLERAAAAGHIECWRIAPALLKAAAQAGYTATQQEAANEHTRQGKRRAKRPQGVIQLSRPLYRGRAD